MEFKTTYNPLGMQIEGYIRKEYENNFQNLRQANSLEQSLESIRVMFKCLGKSRPERGKGVDWTRDMVEAYRTLGEIFNSACFYLVFIIAIKVIFHKINANFISRFFFKPF